MAKLIVSLEGSFLREYPLDKERTSIGRRPTNDVQIDNLAMSGVHATILTIGKDSFLEDLGSTNGTMVNGKSIKKHLLQHNDVIEFGKYQVKYINEALAKSADMESDAGDFEKTMIIRPTASKPIATEQAIPTASASENTLTDPSISPANTKVDVTVEVTPPAETVPTPAFKAQAASTISMSTPLGHLQVLNGSSMGRELLLNKALTTLGKPGVQVAVITKRPQGYFITHVEGKILPIVNGDSTGVQAHQLKDHDIIELGGVKMEFYLG